MIHGMRARSKVEQQAELLVAIVGSKVGRDEQLDVEGRVLV